MHTCIYITSSDKFGFNVINIILSETPLHGNNKVINFITLCCKQYIFSCLLQRRILLCIKQEKIYIVCNIYFVLKQSNADLCWFKQDMKKATFSLVVEGFDRSINGSVKIQGISACNYVWIYKNAHVLFLKSISTFFTLCNYKPFTLWAILQSAAINR